MSAAERGCAFCGSGLQGKRPDAIYCAATCRAAAGRLRRHHRDAAEEASKGVQEAYDHLLLALKRINARYALVAPGNRPDVNGPEWLVYEAEVDRAFGERDLQACIEVVDRYERFAFAELSPEATS